MLLFFRSQRSGVARRMESILATVARKQRERVLVLRVDVDERPELVARYQVKVVPTLVLYDGWRTVGRLTGRASEREIEALLVEHLQRKRPRVPRVASV